MADTVATKKRKREFEGEPRRTRIKDAKTKRLLLVWERDGILNHVSQYFSLEFEPTPEETLLLDLQKSDKVFRPHHYKGPNSDYALLSYFVAKYNVQWEKGDPYTIKDHEDFHGYHLNIAGPVRAIISKHIERLEIEMENWIDSHDWTIKFHCFEEYETGLLKDLLWRYVDYLKEIAKGNVDKISYKHHDACKTIQGNTEWHGAIVDLNVDKMIECLHAPKK